MCFVIVLLFVCLFVCLFFQLLTATGLSKSFENLFVVPPTVGDPHF